MFNIRLTANGKTRRLEPPDTELHSIEGHHLLSLASDVINKPRQAKHVRRDIGFEPVCREELNMP